MRIKALLVLSAVAATATPAFAQGRSCQEARQSNQVGGAIVGGILGGVLGSNVAASGHRHDGTAVGAVLGGIIGSGVGASSARCSPPRSGYGYPPGSDYNRNPGYGGQGYYENGPYGASGYGYSSGPVNMYPSDPGYSPYRYGSDPYDRDTRSQDRYHDDLYRSDGRDYKRNEDFAGVDCSQATQVTRMPDGSEVHRPVEVCRDTYYGDWQVKD